MSPSGIFLFEIDENFGPKIIADYYLSSQKVVPEALKNLSDKHKKDLIDATYKKDKNRYYSSKISAGSIKEQLFLGFQLKEDEDLVSLKSLFENIEQKIAQNFTKDRRQMQNYLKETLSSILSLMEKLKEPKIIQEKINERTKQMLDDGKLQEAREWIELGEKIPDQLSTAVKEAEQFYKQKLYKKAKKGYLKAAELANQIEETEMVSILKNKGEKVGDLPIYFKEREVLNKDLKKLLDDLDARPLDIKFNRAISIIDQSIQKANDLEENDAIEALEELKVSCKSALENVKDLIKRYSDMKNLLNKI